MIFFVDMCWIQLYNFNIVCFGIDLVILRETINTNVNIGMPLVIIAHTGTDYEQVHQKILC